MGAGAVRLWGCLGQCSAGDGLVGLISHPLQPSPHSGHLPWQLPQTLSLGFLASTLPVNQCLVPPVGQAWGCVAIRGCLLSCRL